MRTVILTAAAGLIVLLLAVYPGGVTATLSGVNTPGPTTTPSQATTGTPETDREALIAFFEATDGPLNWVHFRKWRSDAPIGDWYGVQTDLNGRVVGLTLQNNRLSGEIPPELGNLSNLRWLHLYSNQLSGDIPSELGNLSNLESLLLSNNQLSGDIPQELGQPLQLDIPGPLQQPAERQHTFTAGQPLQFEDR